MSTATTTTLVFDASPLNHFAKAGRLHDLEKLVAAYRCVMPEEVTQEIVAGIPRYPALGRVITASWIDVVRLTEVRELVTFARYKAELGGGPSRNNGEAAVLAWVSNHRGVAVIDERAASRMAQRDRIPSHGTLWLVANGIKESKLDHSTAEQIIDELIATSMALPVDGAGFIKWATGHGLLP